MDDYIECYEEWSGKTYYVLPCEKCEFNRQKHETINSTRFITPWCWLKRKNTSTIFGCSDGRKAD